VDDHVPSIQHDHWHGTSAPAVSRHYGLRR
jgi:hypothetical protein